MFDIRKFAKTLPKITVETIDGKIFSGEVIAVFDAEEFEEDEDSLALETPRGSIYSFFPSEIKDAYEI